MHDRWNEVHRAIEQMTAAEKRGLMDELRRSMGEERRQPNGQVTASERRQAIQDLLDEVERLPAADEPADGLVVSRDHDKVLYGGRVPPESPIT